MATIEIETRFSPEDLAAWVEEQFGGFYELRPWEFTVLTYYRAEQKRGGRCSKRQAAYRLDRLVELGQLRKKMEQVDGQEKGVYWRPGDEPVEE